MRSLIRRLGLSGNVSLVLLWVLIWAGCSGRKINENDPADLYQDAESEIESDRYNIAIDKLRVIKNKFPYSSYSAKAQLRIADVYYLQESYLEAAIAYEAFRDLHPKHEQAAYALFRAGEAYVEDAPSNPARDLSSLYKALETFEGYVRSYSAAAATAPDPRLAQAKTKIGEIRNRLASKEYLIAHFYQRTGVSDSAKHRYHKITEVFPDTTYSAQARERLKELE